MSKRPEDMSAITQKDLDAAGIELTLAEFNHRLRAVACAPKSPVPKSPLSGWPLEVISPRLREAPGLAARIEAALVEVAAGYERDITGASRADHAARLARLRAAMAADGLDGFLVPMADDYQNEYVPANARRIAWLTGFTGSAGLVVVLADVAAIFVDGRYTLQADEQVDSALFERRDSSADKPADWLAAHVGDGARIGFDPWLHTEGGLKEIRRALDDIGAVLTPAAGNPLDAAWRNRPPPPLSRAVAHDLAYAGQSTADKRARLGEELAGQDIAAAVLTVPPSIAWLFNIRGGDVACTPLALGFAIVAADGSARLFIDPRKPAPGLAAHLGDAVSLLAPDRFGAALDELGAQGARVLVDDALSPCWVTARLEVAGAALVRGQDPCLLPRARKNPVELEGMRRAHIRDGLALTRFIAWLKQTSPAGGVDEISAADRLAALRAEGDLFRGLSFPTISAAGEHGALPHYGVSRQSNRPLCAGELYLVDSGAQYLDGTTDVTRTLAIGTPDAAHRDRFTRVLQGHIALATARFPAGTSGRQLDTLARAALWRAGLDFDHGTGHGVGAYLGVHEGPQSIAKNRSDVPLEPGMVLSNEPAYYKAGDYGIRIENLMYVTPAREIAGGDQAMLGFEALTMAPIDLDLVEPSLLSAAQIAWLNDYHAMVRAHHTPHLAAAERAWLEQATRAL